MPTSPRSRPPGSRGLPRLTGANSGGAASRETSRTPGRRCRSATGRSSPRPRAGCDPLSARVSHPFLVEYNTAFCRCIPYSIEPREPSPRPYGRIWCCESSCEGWIVTVSICLVTGIGPKTQVVFAHICTRSLHKSSFSLLLSLHPSLAVHTPCVRRDLYS